MTRSKFQPPAYVPTEEEHKIAYLTYCLNRIYYDYLLGIHMVRSGKMKDGIRQEIDGTSSVMELDLKAIDKEFEKYLSQPKGQPEKEVWEIVYPYENFKKNHIEFLSEEHAGDCRAMAAACCRCHAEELYKIESTATWCKYCEYYVNKTCRCGKENKE